MSAKLSFDLNDFSATYGGVLISKYEKDRVIYAQGSSAEALFYVMKGQVQLTAISESGKERVVGLLDAGSFFGEGMPVQATAPHFVGHDHD